MAGSIAMAIQTFQELSNRPIVGNRIGHWNNGIKVYDAILVTCDNRATVRLFSVGILYIVETFGIGFPNVNGDARDRSPTCIFNGANSKKRLAVRIIGDLVAVSHIVRIGCVEGTQNGALGRGLELRVVDGIDKEGKAEDIREEDKFVTNIATDVTDINEELDGGFPFRYAETGFSGKIVQMVDKSLKQEFESGIATI